MTNRVGEEKEYWLWEAKVYDKPSIWGIDSGRISKLYLYRSTGFDESDPNDAGEVVGDGPEYIYDRGWSGEPCPDWMLEPLMVFYPETLDDQG